MKILMVNKFLYPAGGSETYMLQLGKELTRLGHEVEYFGMEHEGNCVGNKENAYTKDMDFHTSNPLKKINYAFSTIYSSEARKKIRKVLDSFKPEVVHLNNFNYQLTPSILMEIRKYDSDNGVKTKIVYTAHDSQLLCPNHLMIIPSTLENCEACLSGDYKNCIKNSCIHNSKAKSIMGAAEAFIYRKLKTYRTIDKIICCSHFLENKMRLHPDLKGKTITLHNFCETTPAAFNPNGKYVLYFGRFAKEKGIMTLIEAAKSLPEIPFVFAGSGELESEINKVKNIKNVGFQRGSALNAYIADAAFSVYPSICYENCPFAVMESILLGTPVIASDIGGIPELIDNESTGILTEPHNAEMLADTIKSTFYDKNKTAKMSENCRSAHFDTLREYTDKLIKIYNEIL